MWKTISEVGVGPGPSSCRSDGDKAEALEGARYMRGFFYRFGEGVDPEEDEQAGEKIAPLISEEQAEQLLDSIGQNTESLRGHIEQVFIVQKDPPAQDW